MDKMQVKFILNSLSGIARAVKEAMEMGNPSKDSAPELFEMVKMMRSQIERLRELLEIEE